MGGKHIEIDLFLNYLFICIDMALVNSWTQQHDCVEIKCAHDIYNISMLEIRTTSEYWKWLDLQMSGLSHSTI